MLTNVDVIRPLLLTMNITAIAVIIIITNTTTITTAFIISTIHIIIIVVVMFSCFLLIDLSVYLFIHVLFL